VCQQHTSDKELLLTGWAAGSEALALQLALRVGIVVRQQNSRVVRAQLLTTSFLNEFA
jgi:hypothetical protein